MSFNEWHKSNTHKLVFTVPWGFFFLFNRASLPHDFHAYIHPQGGHIAFLRLTIVGHKVPTGSLSVVYLCVCVRQPKGRADATMGQQLSLFLSITNIIHAFGRRSIRSIREHTARIALNSLYIVCIPLLLLAALDYRWCSNSPFERENNIIFNLYMWTFIYLFLFN